MREQSAGRRILRHQIDGGRPGDAPEILRRDRARGGMLRIMAVAKPCRAGHRRRGRRGRRSRRGRRTGARARRGRPAATAACGDHGGGRQHRQRAATRNQSGGKLDGDTMATHNAASLACRSTKRTTMGFRSDSKPGIGIRPRAAWGPALLRHGTCLSARSTQDLAMPRRLLPWLLALMCAMAPSASAAEPFTAGERRLATTSPTAAARHNGDTALRLTIWYPASAPEAQVATGPPGSPIFIAGTVARDAPFADAARHP